MIASTKAYKKHLGFCSNECMIKAQQDLLVKDASRDAIDYKSLRGILQSDPTQKQSILTNVQHLFHKKLAKITFRHERSQKEELIVD
jgi:hypothetical protein